MREVWHFGQADFAAGCAGQAKQQELPRKPQANLEDTLRENWQESCQRRIPVKSPAKPPEAQ
jgi:hypothetical protein